MCNSLNDRIEWYSSLFNPETKTLFLERHLLEKHAFLCWGKNAEWWLINVKNPFPKLATFVFILKELTAMLQSWVWDLKVKTKFSYLKQQFIYLSLAITVTKEIPLETLSIQVKEFFIEFLSSTLFNQISSMTLSQTWSF